MERYTRKDETKDWFIDGLIVRCEELPKEIVSKAVFVCNLTDHKMVKLLGPQKDLSEFDAQMLRKSAERGRIVTTTRYHLEKV
jgi:hypothetical protein